MIKKSSTFHDHGVAICISRRVIETWYVYKALTKLVEASIDVDDGHDTSTIRFINRHDFIHPKSEVYGLTTVNIHPDDPEDATAQTCPHLITGFF